VQGVPEDRPRTAQAPSFGYPLSAKVVGVMSLEGRVQSLERKERTRALADRRAQLQRDGYIGHVHNPLHAQAVRRDPCEDCGQRKVAYIGGVCEAADPWGRVEWIRCSACGHWEEI
jgi:hypothetical protein